MKNLFKKININSSFIFLIFLSLISGLIKDIFCLFFVLFIHEIGHIVFSYYYKWNIKKINISCIGGYILYEEDIDKSFKEELMISIAGVLFQFLFLIILIITKEYFYIDYKLFSKLYKYDLAILFFNLIPIIPLDGSKIVNIVLNYFFSFKLSNKLLNYISIFNLIIIIVIIYIKEQNMECSYIMLFVQLIKNIKESIKQEHFLFNKFLYERFSRNYKFNKKNYIYSKNIKKMKRQRRNLFITENKCIDEKELLYKRFDL